MYNIPYFKANNNDDVIAFMQANPFIILCGIDSDNKPIATHIPVLVDYRDGKVFLQGHLMRKQLHTSAFENNRNILAIFSGTNSYVSATNYTIQNVASTWNYKAVHASGVVNFMSDNFLYNLLKKITLYFEKNSNSPSTLEKMDEKYVIDNMKAIVGIEIEVKSIEHTFKLSQNKDVESRNNIINNLQKKVDSNSIDMANNMKEFYKTID